jgi:hypothetical protein
MRMRLMVKLDKSRAKEMNERAAEGYRIVVSDRGGDHGKTTLRARGQDLEARPWHR